MTNPATPIQPQRTLPRSTGRKRRVLAFGTFDLLHPGHKYYLEQARRLGDELVVIIGRDRTVLGVKKAWPLRDEETRRISVERLKPVSKAVLGNERHVYRVLDDYRPDVIALGYDQKAFTRNLKRELKRRRLRCSIVRIDAYRPEEFKSSLLKKQYQDSKKNPPKDQDLPKE